MQIFARHLESLEDFAGAEDASGWLRRESAALLDAMRALEEKAGLFRLYLKDVTGPAGSSHRHKLLFASQYLVETAVQLLRAFDTAAVETIVQMACRVVVTARRVLAAAFHRKQASDSSASDSSTPLCFCYIRFSTPLFNIVHTIYNFLKTFFLFEKKKATRGEGKPLPLKTLLPLFTDLLITLTNAVWKRGLQLPDVMLRIQLDQVRLECSLRLFVFSSQLFSPFVVRTVSIDLCCCWRLCKNLD